MLIKDYVKHKINKINNNLKTIKSLNKVVKDSNINIINKLQNKLMKHIGGIPNNDRTYNIFYRLFNSFKNRNNKTYNIKYNIEYDNDVIKYKQSNLFLDLYLFLYYYLDINKLNNDNVIEIFKIYNVLLNNILNKKNDDETENINKMILIIYDVEIKKSFREYIDNILKNNETIDEKKLLYDVTSKDLLIDYNIVLYILNKFKIFNISDLLDDNYEILIKLINNNLSNNPYLKNLRILIMNTYLCMSLDDVYYMLKQQNDNYIKYNENLNENKIFENNIFLNENKSINNIVNEKNEKVIYNNDDIKIILNNYLI